MTFEVLVIIIVVINAILTLSLWRKVHSRGRPKLNKKAAAALWRSEPIIPKHDPPKTVSPFAGDNDRQFFADFRDFADVMNWWLATGSRFRLQDLPDDDARLDMDLSDGPVPARAFAIYYNQTRVGRLEIGCLHSYTSALPEVYTSLKIDWARFFGVDVLTEFLNALAIHLTTGRAENSDYINARLSIQSDLTRTLWDNYVTDDDEDWGELTVSFQGKAFFYIDRKGAPARPGSFRR